MIHLRNSSSKILLIAIIIAVLSILSIYSSTHQKEGRLWQDIYKRQVLWVLLGMLFFIAVSNFNYRLLWDWTYPLYALVLFFLALVFALGVVRLGAQRWLKVAWFNFQPSEFAKLAMVIFLARYFSKKSQTSMLPDSAGFGLLKGIIVPFAFIAVPMFLIIEQPDLGSGMMIFLLFIIMLYLSELKKKYIFMLVVCVCIAAPFMWHLMRDYQKERLMVFMNPNIDPLGAGYTVLQSKIAIGSGGLWGKGWLAGTQSQLRFLPESHTDFIFATFTEERGLLGSSLLLFLFFMLVRQGLLISQRQESTFAKLLAAGVSSLLAIQIFINIAMNMGLAPVVGLPLPLMSYGGSSILATFISLGVLASIDRRS